MPADQDYHLKEIILSVLRNDWLKTAMVIAKAFRDCEVKNIPVSHEEIAAAILVLCDTNQLVSRGDITDWRHSELRLP